MELQSKSGKEVEGDKTKLQHSTARQYFFLTSKQNK
jgi:hypothetical protein